MANQITDNRTALFVAQTSAPASETWEASGGGGSIVEDTDIFIEGTTSVAEQISTSRRVMLWDNGSTQDLSNGHVYIWVNCGIVGLLDTKANGGLTIRLTGPTSTNFVEWYVGGSDSWPTSIKGGWTMFVVDTASTPSNTGGTAPALTAIQKVGISAITASVMTKTADNTWVDAAWFLPDATAGILIEGRNGGSTPWTFADIHTQLGDSAGMFVPGDGGAWVCNAPIKLGINDGTWHEFDDSNQTILWSDQEFAASDLYDISTEGGSSGFLFFTLGVVTGTGDDRAGSQGCTFIAAATGVRYTLTLNHALTDDALLYGCTFIHAGDILFNDLGLQAISCTFIDCTSVDVTGGKLLKCSVVDANTADGVAFVTTDDLGDVVRCDFSFSDGHGIELTTPRIATQTSKGNIFTGYAAQGGNANDRMVYNNTAGLVDISVTDGGTFITYRDGTSASTTVTQDVTVTLDNMRDNTEVRVFATGTQTELTGIEDATVGSTDDRSFDVTLAAATAVDIRIINKQYEYIKLTNYIMPSADASLPIQQRFDRTYSNP